MLKETRFSGQKMEDINEEALKHQDEYAKNSSALLLITANVGSLFEDPARLFNPWIKEFLKKVSELQPQFLALHLQEVGGKTYEKSMQYVQEFITTLCEASEMKDFSFIRVYMDEDFKSAEHFTALGNVYFAHKNLKNVKVWNFITHDWEDSVEDKNIYSGNIETVATKEKSKFPKHFFPECKWSRKGFMRTRWEINGTVIDLVNIHLFHDASNLAACEEFPSIYCRTRRRALIYTLERFHSDENGPAPYFIFGDFNFRCDTEGVIKELTENLTAHRMQNVKSDSTKIHYRNSVGNNVLTVGKKEFNHADHQLKFKENWLKKYDKELDALTNVLVEYSIKFPPSYPYEEDPEMPNDYMSTRCPSWCDRILMNPQAKHLIFETENITSSYNLIGEHVCMGDHKPIYLNIRLKPNQGTYRCCNCYLESVNINKSTSHHNPAILIRYMNSGTQCPHQNEVYYETLLEFKSLHEKTIRANLTNTIQPRNGGYHIEPQVPQLSLKSSQADESDGAIIKKELQPISINIIDSDNAHVCMCTQIVSTALDERFAFGKNVVDNGNETICTECRNIVKNKSSKKVILQNNIIVNRIDTQHLNTFDGAHQRQQDPYTPESAESHSPCPEFNSTSNTTTSTSSKNHSPFAIDRSAAESETLAKSDVGTLSVGKPINYYKQCSDSNVDGLVEMQQNNRGIVSPCQLKSRLEDLQRSSVHTLNENYSSGYDGGDVEVVDQACQQSINATYKRHKNSCLPECCNIC